VNERYVDKAGKRERGTVGDRLVVDRDYFYRAVGDRKRLSGAIKGSIDESMAARTTPSKSLLGASDRCGECVWRREVKAQGLVRVDR
jgi:hypothetical protein